MKRKEFKYGQDARDAIRRVAEEIGDTLGKTLGPAGRNYQIPEGITNDGRSILSHIRFADECEDNVALAFHEVANQTDRTAGDGTTTAIVLASRLTASLVDHIPDINTPFPGQRSVMDLSRSLETEKDIVVKALEERKIPVTTLEQLEQVAFTSMENKETAKLVAETIFKAGPGSFTALDEGFSGKIETNVQAGIEMPLSVAAPFMLNKGKEAIYEGTIPVLVANHLFEDYRELTNFMQTCLDFQKSNGVGFPSLVIVGKQFSIPFIQSVQRVHAGTNGAVNILCISNSHFADDLFEDIASFCDADYVDTHPKNGQKIQNVNFQSCGLVSKIVANGKGVVFYGGKGTTLQSGQETTRVQGRILELREQLSQEKDKTKRHALERRIAEFSGGKATIYVDAPTAAEKIYVKLKVEDCMNSCKAALEGGMVRGGGLTLKEIADTLPEDSLLAPALREPYLRIQQNAGGALEIGDDVMDSLLVAKAGVESAVSVVKTVLTLEGIIADVPRSLVDELQTAIHGN